MKFSLRFVVNEVQMARLLLAAEEYRIPLPSIAIEKEPQTEFEVRITSLGANKIAVIKAIRELTAVGLKEAKDIVEIAPHSVARGVSSERAKQIVDALNGAGATAGIW